MLLLHIGITQVCTQTSMVTWIARGQNWDDHYKKDQNPTETIILYGYQRWCGLFRPLAGRSPCQTTICIQLISANGNVAQFFWQGQYTLAHAIITVSVHRIHTYKKYIIYKVYIRTNNTVGIKETCAKEVDYIKQEWSQKGLFDVCLHVTP